MSAPGLSAVVIARNESAMIERCLAHLGFADEVLVALDVRSDDDTAEQARAAGARVESIRFATFSEARNLALDLALGPWVLFVDADERVPSALAAEVERAVAGPPAGYRVRIENWFYGAKVERSGYRERPLRLFPAEGVRYSGDIHERPVLPAGLPEDTLVTPLLHLSHRSVVQNLRKTADYADVQAGEMLQAGHAPVTRRSMTGVVLRTLARHLVVGQGFRDGTAGFVESLYQAFSIWSVHARLWELQQDPGVEQRYADLEDSIR